MCSKYVHHYLVQRFHEHGLQRWIPRSSWVKRIGLISYWSGLTTLRLSLIVRNSVAEMAANIDLHGQLVARHTLSLALCDDTCIILSRFAISADTNGSTIECEKAHWESWRHSSSILRQEASILSNRGSTRHFTKSRRGITREFTTITSIWKKDQSIF
jgi:hypothetical protein